MGQGGVNISGLFLALFLMGVSFTASPALSQNTASTVTPCIQKKPYRSEIKINLEVPEPYYDLTRDIKFLNNDGGESKREWLAKNGMEGVWSSDHMTTLGMASGGWAANYIWKLDAEPLDQYWAYACIYVKEMELNMIYRTMIIIPKDYPKDSCEFEVIHEHELKHYKTNRLVALKTAKKLEDDMPVILSTLEGPHVGSDFLKNRANEIKKSVKELVDVYFKQVMAEELRRLNGQIDNVDEYSNFSKKVAECEFRRRNVSVPQTGAKQAAPYVNRTGETGQTGQIGQTLAP